MERDSFICDSWVNFEAALKNRISIIIPALNEGEEIVRTLKWLACDRSAGHEVIVVDGGSDDKTALLAVDSADHVVSSERGRARQMNRGAALAAGEILLFLHADTQLPEGGVALIQDAVASGSVWGRFDVRLSGQHPLFRVIEKMMNWRSSLTGIATGDQAIFVRRELFEAVGGFADQPLMEDIELSKQLKKVATPHLIRQAVVTSSRRWEQRGIFTTMLLMWRLRFLYWRGVDAESLAKMYR